MNKEELIQKAYKKGFYYEKTFRGCAQCTVAAIFDVLNIENDTIFKAACGLASGGGLSCEGTCGGYTGSVMVMSSLFGRRRKFFDNDEDYKRTAFRMAKILQEKFFNEFNTLTCNEIHKIVFGRTYDLWNPDEKHQFSLDGSHKMKCTNVVGLSASWAVELIIAELEYRDFGLEDLNSLLKNN